MRRAALIVVSFAVSIGCCYLALRHISLDAMWESLKSADYGWVIPATLLTIASGFVRAVRWRWLFHDPGAFSDREGFAAFSVGLMGNNVLPARGGEVMRVFSLRRSSGLSAVEIGTTILLERMVDVFALALIGVAISPWLPDRGWVHALALLCAALLVVCVALVVVALALRERLPRVVTRLLSALPGIGAARADTLRGGLQAGVRVLRHRRRLLGAVALSLAGWIVCGLSCVVLMPAFGLSAHSLAPWLVLVANSFALVVPSSPGTVGVYEASVQASLTAFGISSSTALSFALVLHAINFFPIIAVGLGAAWYLRRRPAHARFAVET